MCVQNLTHEAVVAGSVGPISLATWLGVVPVASMYTYQPIEDDHDGDDGGGKNNVADLQF